jgi:Domain of unknown function (DUF4160)
MPTISMFYGILIKMFFDDHAPHFHAEYAEFKATIDIKKLVVIDGQLPRRAQELVLDWAELSFIKTNYWKTGSYVHQDSSLKKFRLCNRYLSYVLGCN